MEKNFHPVSGEQLYAYTEKEQDLIVLALNELNNRTSSSVIVDGVNHG